MTRTASCACGALSLRCPDVPLLVSMCHCSACQKRTGGPFGIAAFFRNEEVEIDGAYSDYTRSSDAGYDVQFHFCGTCGSTVFWHPARMPDLVAVGVGAFGDPDFPAPSQEVFTGCRHSWVAPLAPQGG